MIFGFTGISWANDAENIRERVITSDILFIGVGC